MHGRSTSRLRQRHERREDLPFHIAQIHPIHSTWPDHDAHHPEGAGYLVSFPERLFSDAFQRRPLTPATRRVQRDPTANRHTTRSFLRAKPVGL